MKRRLFGYLMITAISALLCTACPDPSGSLPDTSASGAALLASYGVSVVPARASTDPQPLGTTVARAMSRRQIATSGLLFESSTDPRVISFEENTASTLFTGNNEDWTANPHCSIPVLLGDDGKESLVSIVFVPDTTNYTVGPLTGTVQLLVWDGASYNAYSPFAGKPGELFTLYLCAWGGNWYYQLNNELSAAAGDLTGDGKDEIGFCVGNRFIILDGNLLTVLYDGFVTGSGVEDNDTSTIHPSRVAAGDITGDGRISFVTTYGSAKANAVASWKIFNGAKPVLAASGTLGGGTCPLTLMYANVAIANIDGKGMNELVFAGRQDMAVNPLNLVMANYDPDGKGFVFWSDNLTMPLDGNLWGSTPIPPLVAFNPDKKTDNRDPAPDTLLVWNTLYRYDSATKALAAGYKGTTVITLPLYTNVFGADVNYDFKDDLVSLSSAAGVGIEVYSLGVANTSFARNVIPAQVSPATCPFMGICGADIDGQSVVVEYLGTSVQYTDPLVLAVLAAAPFYGDAEGSATGSTSLTMYEQTSQEDSASFSLSASMSFGGSGACPLWNSAGEMEIKHTFGASFNSSFSSWTTITTTRSFTTSGPNDAVIFSCIPYDTFSYRVIRSPNATYINTTMTIGIPRDPQIIFMEKDIYNALPSNKALIGSSVLSHTSGDPSSYRDQATLQALCSERGGFIDQAGTGSPVGITLETSSAVSVEKGTATSFGAGLSITTSVTEVALGCLFGAEIGFEAAYDYEFSSSSGTEISTTVSGTTGQDRHFTYGAAAYQLKDETVQTSPFLVVTCWVDMD